MVRQMAVTVHESGRVVLYRGQRVEARPSRRLGLWYVRARVDGKPRTFPVYADALEPVDDLDLPEPEPLAVTVPPALLDRDPHAWPFALAALATLVVAALMF